MFKTIPEHSARQLEHLLDTKIIGNIQGLRVSFSTPNNGAGEYLGHWVRWRRYVGGWRVESALKRAEFGIKKLEEC